jgi:DNA-binding winged helix-turn-helix (wHTH) protein
MTALILSSGREFRSVDDLLDYADQMEELTKQLRQDAGLAPDQAMLTRLSAHWRLTSKEGSLLSFLYRRGGVAASKEQIMTAVYGLADDVPEIKIVDVFVCKIRGKVGADAIITDWGRGYRLSAECLEKITALLAIPLPDVQRAPEAPRTRLKRETVQGKVLEKLQDAEHGMTVSEMAAVYPEGPTTYHHALSMVEAMRRLGRIRACGSERKGRRGGMCKVYVITDVGRAYVRENMPAL